MIEIKVTDSELFLKSEYSQSIVSFMRSRPKRFWDKENRTWILPKDDLELLLKLLSGCEYKITYDKPDIHEEVKLPDWYKFKTEPFNHQINGIAYGLNHPKFLLADEQGLGKTKTMLDLSSILKKEKDIKHVLIITCVNGLKYNWRNEIEKHTDYTGYILGTRYSKKGKESIGSNEDRLADVLSIGNNETIDKNFYIITNIETLRYNKIEKIPLKTKKNGVQRFKKQTRYPIVEALQEQIKKGNISMIIADEIHQCFSGDTLVKTSDGFVPIKSIIDNKNFYVATYDDSGNVSYVKPSNYFINQIQNSMLSLRIKLSSGEEKTIVCTENHKILTKNRGYVEAKNLTCDDDIVEAFNL